MPDKDGPIGQRIADGGGGKIARKGHLGRKAANLALYGGCAIIGEA